MIGIDAIRARAEATLALVAELRRGGVIGAAVEAALTRSINGHLVPPSAVWVDAGLAPAVPTVADELAELRAERDRLRMAIIAWRFLDSVDEYHREEQLYALAAELVEALPGPDVMPSDEVMSRALDPRRAAIEYGGAS